MPPNNLRSYCQQLLIGCLLAGLVSLSSSSVTLNPFLVASVQIVGCLVLLFIALPRNADQSNRTYVVSAIVLSVGAVSLGLPFCFSQWPLLTAHANLILWGTAIHFLLLTNLASTQHRLADAKAILEREVCERVSASNRLEQAKREIKRALDTKAKEIETIEQRVLQRERLGAINEISAGVSHELNNSLTPIVQYADLLLEHAQLSDRHLAWVRRIAQSADAAVGVVRNLQRFDDHQDETKLTRISTVAIANQAISAVRPIWLQRVESSGHGISVQNRIPIQQGNRRRLAPNPTATHNLLMNSIDAVQGNPHGEIVVRTRRTQTLYCSKSLTMDEDESGGTEVLLRTVLHHKV